MSEIWKSLPPASAPAADSRWAQISNSCPGGADLALPGNQILVRGRVVGDARVKAEEAGLPSAPCSEMRKSLIPVSAAGGGKPLGEDLELVVDERRGVVVAVPDDQVLVRGRIGRDAGGKGLVVLVQLRAHVGDPEIVDADLGAGSGQPLGEDLELLARADLAPPCDQVLVRGPVVGDARILGR